MNGPRRTCGCWPRRSCGSRSRRCGRWLKDPAGHWHLAVAASYLTRSTEVVVVPLRLIPPLAAYPDTIEVVVTGTSAGSVRSCRTGRKGAH
jgi:hypothetical protein